MIRIVVVVLLAYLLGSIPTGLWMGRLVAGVDVRQVGSQRTGATNVQRSLGTRIAILVLVLDFLKGSAAVMLGRLALGSDSFAIITGLVAMIGHIHPVFAGFRGGRGVATGAGAMAAMSPLPLILCFVTMAVVIKLTRYVSLGSIAAGLGAGIFAALLLNRLPGSDMGVPFGVLAGAMVLVKHSDNVHRLLHGKESRLGQRVIVTGSDTGQ
ncbi:MAG: glycerol-3-phosphate 1-O-acyltransferase PlsY [Candidatus Dormibacteria bacterium]